MTAHNNWDAEIVHGLNEKLQLFDLLLILHKNKGKH